MKAVIAALALSSVGLTYAEDMQKYLTKTQELVAEGKHEEALERFIWFHEHALEHDQAMVGVRLSFALSYWKRLGESYPPALKALVKTRDDKAELMREGKGNRELFHDVVALNRTLEEPGKTVALFEFISKDELGKAKDYWSIAKDAIFEQKRYDLARKYIEDLEDEFVNVKEGYDRNVALFEDPQIGGAAFKVYNENKFVKEAQKLIELALALGDRDSAIILQDKALDVIDDERLNIPIPKKDAQQDGIRKP